MTELDYCILIGLSVFVISTLFESIRGVERKL
jgi:hypothetical protein